MLRRTITEMSAHRRWSSSDMREIDENFSARSYDRGHDHYPIDTYFLTWMRVLDGTPQSVLSLP